MASRLGPGRLSRPSFRAHPAVPALARPGGRANAVGRTGLPTQGFLWAWPAAVWHPLLTRRRARRPVPAEVRDVGGCLLPCPGQAASALVPRPHSPDRRECRGPCPLRTLALLLPAPFTHPTGARPCSRNYSPWSGSLRGLNNIVYPQLPHITGTTAEPSTGAPSAVSGSGVEMITCSGPTENCPWAQTAHPCKPLDVRNCSIRSLLCCCASEAMRSSP